MNLKRFILTIAAICMVFGMSITAFADTEAPDNVRAETIVQTDATATSVTVSWLGKGSADTYQIYLNGTFVKETSSTEATLTVSKGSSNTVKIVSVAYATDGTAVYSSGVEVSDIKATPTAPKKVGDFSSGNLTWLPTVSNKVTVGWNDASSLQYTPDGYQVVIYSMKGKKLKTYTVNSGSVSFKNKKVKNVGFKIQVRAFVTINGTKYYGTWSSKKAIIPQAKISLKQTSSFSNSATIKVSWKKVKNATKYIVYVCSDISKDATAWKKVKTVSASTRSVYISNCKVGNATAVYVVPVVKYGKKTYKSQFTWYLYKKIS